MRQHPKEQVPALTSPSPRPYGEKVRMRGGFSEHGQPNRSFVPKNSLKSIPPLSTSLILPLAVCWRERECRPGNPGKCGAGGSRNGSGQIRPRSRWTAGPVQWRCVAALQTIATRPIRAIAGQAGRTEVQTSAGRGTPRYSITKGNHRADPAPGFPLSKESVL